jgi:putative membrane protein
MLATRAKADGRPWRATVAGMTGASRPASGPVLQHAQTIRSTGARHGRTQPDKGIPMRLLLAWLINTAALFAVSWVMKTVEISDFTTALIAALVLGLVNTLVRPVLVLLTLPVTVITLGLFIFVINGLMFWAVASMVTGFYVAGFWAAIGGALLYSAISWALSALLLKE